MTDIYAVIAYIARYWFLLLAVVIIWRAFIWIRKDAARTQRADSRLPDAGAIGEWVVVTSGVEGVPEGHMQKATQDGWIGSARACDVRVRADGVPARVARFTLRRDGLHVLPRARGEVQVDGEPVLREAVLRHGATLTVGGITLQLRLFAGVLLEGETPATNQNKSLRDKLPVAEPAAPAGTELPKPALTVRIPRNRSEKRGTTTDA